jgi:sugar O-acyltransferase (sialic acid O-acetyltransferase NeuD family)
MTNKNMTNLKTKKLLIFGDSAFAEVAYELFSHDSNYEVAAFVVDIEYKTKSELFGLPVVDFESVAENYPPDDYDMHVALVYNKLNRVRKAKYEAAKAKGYRLANYISSRAFVWPNVEMGDNLFIFEDNTIQPFVKLGSNIVLWSGNHIGHHSTIDSHCFISSHVVVSGFVNIGKSCFAGVNSSFANNIDIGDDCLIGAGALIVKSLPKGSLVRGTPSPIDGQTTHEKFGIEED